MYLDPLDSHAWASTLQTLANDPAELEELRQLAARAEGTTVANMVDGYMELLK